MDLIESQAATYEAIVSELAAGDGISRIYMWQLRDANGNDRLGVNVAADITEELDRRGVGAEPSLGTQTQWDMVRVFLKNSEVGKIIDSLGKMTDKADKRLLNAARCAEAMSRIKRLVT